MAKTITVGQDAFKELRLEVPKDLTRQQLTNLRHKYTDTIVKSKKDMMKSFDKYKEFLAVVMSCRRDLNDAEDRLIEVYEGLENLK